MLTYATRYLALPIVFSGLLVSACGGGIATDYADAFDPHEVRPAGMIGVSVLGANQPADAVAISKSVVAAMRDLRYTAEAEQGDGTTYAYEAKIVIGVAAANLKRLAKGNDYRLCDLANHDNYVLAAPPASAAAHSLPVYGVMCKGDLFESVAFGLVPAETQQAAAGVAKLVQWMLPSANPNMRPAGSG